MKIDKFKSWAFVIILLGVGLLNLGMHTNLEKSETENRTLQTFPDLSVKAYFKDGLTTKIDAYINDQFMFRNHMISISKSIEGARGITETIKVATVAGDNMVTPKDNEENTGEPAEKDQTQEGEISESEPQKDVQINYFILEDRVFRSFKKNEPAEVSFAKTLNDFALENQNVTVYSLVAPTQASFVTGKYKSLTDDPNKSILRIENLLDPSVKCVNTIDIMMETQDENTFFKTDHHWNGLGAYYAYVTFCETKGITPVSLDEMKKIKVEDFVGSFYTMTNDDSIKSFPDTIEAYLPKYPVEMTRMYMDEAKNVTKLDPLPYSISKAFMGGVPSYALFIGGDNSVSVIETQSDDVSGNILVVKDSYGNSFSPYLSNNYKTVHIIDPRYWQGSLKTYIEENEIDDVLFINNADITLYDAYDEILRKVF